MRYSLIAILAFLPASAFAQTSPGLAPPNTVVAGPASGVTKALPAPRALVPADLPALAATSIDAGGATAITNGNSNDILFQSIGGNISEIATANSSVLITSSGGVPSFSTTLPSGLSAPSFSVTTAFTATGLVTNADLVNAATTVNGQTCTLGSTCTVSAAASSLIVGTSTITSGTTNGLLYDNGGVLGNLATANGGVLVTSSSGVPSVSITPVLGVQQTSQGTLTLANTAAGAFATTLQSSNSASAAATYTMPTAPPGSNGYALTATTAGVMSWTAVSGAGGSPCTTTALSVQYNAAGALGCVAGVTSNGTTMTFANGDLKLSGSSSGTSILEAPATGGGTVTLMAGTDTVAGLGTTQTFTGGNIFAAGSNGSPKLSIGVAGTGFFSASTNQFGFNINGGLAQDFGITNFNAYSINTQLYLNATVHGPDISQWTGAGFTAIGIGIASVSSVPLFISGGTSTTKDGIVTANLGLATVGVQQWSPRLRLTGSGWKTNATAGSQAVDWIVENQPVQGTASPSSNLVFSNQINAGGYTARETFLSSGGMAVGTATDPGAGSLILNGQIFMPNITTSSAGVTGTVCWTTSTGAFTVDTTTTCLASLEELKDIRGPITGALDIVNRLDPFWFSWKDGTPERAGDTSIQPGLGAHQVASVDKRLAAYDANGALHSVRYQEMSAILVAAIKELKADNDSLRSEFNRVRKASR